MIWVHNSRIIAVFAVIAIHVTASVIMENHIGTNSWWVGSIYNSTVRWAVPVFVMISGALLLDPSKNECLTVFYKKRLSKILIPIVAWTIFFLLYFVFVNASRGNETSVMGLVKRVLLGKPYYHLWFLYMLFPLYAFTPYFRKVITQSNKKELEILIASMLTLAAINHFYVAISAGQYILLTNWFLPYTPIFFLGYYIRQDKKSPSKILLWSTFLIACAITCYGTYFVATEIDQKMSPYFSRSLSVSVIPMFISVMYLLKTWNAPIISSEVTEKISSMTFGIYLIHPVILEAINARFSALISLHPWILILIVTTVVFLISLVVIWAIQKVPYLRRTI